MVPVRSILLSEVERALLAAVGGQALSLVQQGCLYWLDSAAYSESNDSLGIEKEVASDYTALAYIGYVSIAREDSSLGDAVVRGCKWFVGRNIRRTTGDLQAFALDPVGLLGILLGIRAAGDSRLESSVGTRIKEALQASGPSYAQDPLKSAFRDACNCILEGTLSVEASTSPAILNALLSRLAIETPLLLADAALSESTKAATEDVDAFTAALHLASLHVLLRQSSAINLQRPTVEQILAVLNGVEAGLFRWAYGQNKTQKWEVANEYDVQSMLYFLLKPILPELKEEEVLPSIGRKRPRVDLVVPSMRLSIEVKFLRKSEQFNSILGEVAEDKSLYLGPSSAYSRMIVFLWDDSSRTEEHALFRQGVQELGLDGAVVVSRPAFMERT